jgi:hypothetical protein
MRTVGNPLGLEEGLRLISRHNGRRLLVTLAIIAGLVTVAVPACIAGVCDLSPNPTHSGNTSHTATSPGSISHAMAPVLQGLCDVATNGASIVENVGPLSSAAPQVGFLAALSIALFSLVSRLTLFSLRALVPEPPVPLVDLRGVRLLI